MTSCFEGEMILKRIDVSMIIKIRTKIAFFDLDSHHATDSILNDIMTNLDRYKISRVISQENPTLLIEEKNNAV